MFDRTCCGSFSPFLVDVYQGFNSNSIEGSGAHCLEVLDGALWHLALGQKGGFMRWADMPLGHGVRCYV
jgi:hypothetical protein